MAKKIEVNKQLAQKVIEVVTPGLCNGLGDPEPGKMCVEAAVNYACGLPHGDNPSCVGQAVRGFKIDLNDQNWSSNKARAKGMIKIAIAQLGSNVISQEGFKTLMLKEVNAYIKPFLIKDFKKNVEEKVNKILKDKNLSFSAKKSKIINICEGWEDYSEEISYYNIISDTCDYLPKMSNDKYFTLLADICLKVLKKMKSPGCKYLYLLNK